jgi:CubicO group peptidase (beta-lactamase class C family)
MIMKSRSARWLLVMITMLATVLACSPSTLQPSPTPSRPPIDYAALEAAIEKAITSRPATLDNVRAVLINVDDKTKIAHYRHGFTGDHHEHVWSVTKSVVSTLIGIAIADGLIADLDQPLSALLPEHQKAMSRDVANVTLRQLMSMTAGFRPEMPARALWEKVKTDHGDFVDLLLERRLPLEPDKSFAYSDISAHLVVAVLASALERAGGDQPGTVLDYARAKLFDPLGIVTRPAFSDTVIDPYGDAFAKAGFAWGTDPNGIEIGAYGMRLSAQDMIKLGELYRHDGVWQGKQIVPAEWIRQATRPSEVNPEYGLLWWTVGKPQQLGYAAQGSGGQSIVVLPKARAVVVILAATRLDNQISNEDLKPLTEGVLAPALL